MGKLVETCEYDKSEEQVRDQYVCSCQSGKLREKLLRIPNLDLTKLMKVGQIYEQSKHQADEINAAEYQQEVNYQHVRKLKTTKSRGKAKVCFKCGKAFIPGHTQNCPAKGKTCSYCGITGHFQSMCLEKETVRAINNEQSESSHSSSDEVENLTDVVNNKNTSSYKTVLSS